MKKAVDKNCFFVYTVTVGFKLDNHLPFQFNLKLMCAFLAQLDRALVYGTKGRGFESLRTHQERKREEERSFFLLEEEKLKRDSNGP